jgi:hypothetical protein
MVVCASQDRAGSQADLREADCSTSVLDGQRSVHSRTPISLRFFVRLPSTTATGTVEGAGEDGLVTAKLLGASIRDKESQLVPYAGKPSATTLGDQ